MVQYRSISFIKLSKLKEGTAQEEDGSDGIIEAFFFKFTLQLRFVTLPLFVEDVDLDGQIRVGDCLILQLVEGGQQLHANEFVADAQPILELRGRNDDAVDESHQCRLVFDCRSIAQFAYNNGETVTITWGFRSGSLS